MTESVDRQTAVLRLRGADDILILCHKNPDGDTIGCAGALYLALKALGKNAAILCSDPIPKMYDYMELRWFDGSFNPAFVVAVDVASIQLFGENNNVPQYAAHTNLCIDHHASNSGYAYETLLDPGAAAACEFLLDVIVDMGVTITPQIANCLYTGIATDTGCFKFASTTPRTHMAAARVMEAGGQHDCGYRRRHGGSGCYQPFRHCGIPQRTLCGRCAGSEHYQLYQAQIQPAGGRTHC